MIEVLKHSETHILKTANESAHVRVTAALYDKITSLRYNIYPQHLFSPSEANHTVPSGDPPSWGGRPPPQPHSFLHPHPTLCFLQNSPQKVCSKGGKGFLWMCLRLRSTALEAVGIVNLLF